jgi:hypothetical protein
MKNLNNFFLRIFQMSFHSFIQIQKITNNILNITKEFMYNCG